MSDWMEDTLVRPRVTSGDSQPLQARAQPEVSLFDRLAWRDALLAWLGQVALVFVVIYVGRTLLIALNSTPTAPISWGDLFSKWLGWDGALYAFIAANGYNLPWTAAFSPVLPTLEHLVSAATGLNPQVAGGLVSLFTAPIAYGLFRILVERELGRDTARRALLYLVVFPTAFFFLTAYTESLFIAFTCGAFLAMRWGRWVASGALIALATLTHLTGVILLASLALEMARRWRQDGLPTDWRERGNLIAGLAITPMALGVFVLYLYHQFGTFFAISRAETTVWGKGLSVPMMGFARAGGALIRDGYHPSLEQVHILLDGSFTLVLIAMTVAVWRLLPRAYGVYTGALTLVIISTPLHNWYSLMSNPRFFLAAFPVFMLFGAWGVRSWVDRLILGISLPLLAIFTLLFAMAAWVA